MSSDKLPPLAWDTLPRPEDVDAVRAIVHSTGVFSAEEARVAGDLVQETLDGTEDYAFIFARTINKKLAGYACFGRIPLTEGSYDLYWIVVSASMHGNGLGSEIMKRTEQRVKNSGGAAIYAETSGRADYASSRKFYEHLGFTEAANLPDFYRKNDAKIIYVKKL